jgi:hypothetical protein
MELIVIITLLVALVILTPIFGVDSREGSTDPRSPAQPVGIR